MLKCTFMIGLLVAPPAIAQCSPCEKAYDDNVLLTVSIASQNITYAIRVTSTNARAFMALLIYTDGMDGDVGIWSHNAANNRPLTPLATAVWSSTNTSTAWKGANFAKPAIVLANTTYWVVLRITQLAAFPSVRAKSLSGQTYVFSRDRGLTWAGPHSGFEWKYRIHCCSLNNLASFAPFGKGCGPTSRGAPIIGASLAPLLGRNFDVTVTNARPSTAALLAMGASNSRWGAISLPFDLTPLGAPGCSVLVSFDLLLPVATSTAGAATVRLTIPNNQALLGFRFFDQWTVLDPSANPLGMAFSRGARAEVGR